MKKDELLLIQLILMFQTAAMQHMGKIKNPLTEKVEQDLQQAQISIDILELLQRKMKNNLSADEEKMFSTVLQDLRLNYVDEIGKAQKAATPPLEPTSSAT